MRGYNRIRRGIKRFFPSRRCFVLPLPTTNTEGLMHVERLKESELTPAFVDDVRDLSNFVLGRTTGRVIAGRAMDGSSSFCSCSLLLFHRLCVFVRSQAIAVIYIKSRKRTRRHSVHASIDQFS